MALALTKTRQINDIMTHNGMEERKGMGMGVVVQGVPNCIMLVLDLWILQCSHFSFFFPVYQRYEKEQRT